MRPEDFKALQKRIDELPDRCRVAIKYRRDIGASDEVTGYLLKEAIDLKNYSMHVYHRKSDGLYTRNKTRIPLENIVTINIDKLEKEAPYKPKIDSKVSIVDLGEDIPPKFKE